MNRLLITIFLITLLIGIASITAAQKASVYDQTVDSTLTSGVIHSCFDAAVKLRKYITQDDPSDPALTGMEIQARAFDKLQENLQEC